MEGIWRFLPKSRAKYFESFLEKYHAIRREEGWGSQNAAYYRELPHVEKSDPLYSVWRIREKNFARFESFVNSKPLKILDIGTGNGWLSNQFMRRGHIVAALDISDDERDGLGAWRNYEKGFSWYQSEFSHMPFRETQFDLAIFNASLHYSIDLDATLIEAGRVLARGGKIIIMDSPFYSESKNGEAMREQQIARLGKKNDLGMLGFLTHTELNRAATEAGMKLEILAADEEWHKKLRRVMIQKKLRREPARFPIVILKK